MPFRNRQDLEDGPRLAFQRIYEASLARLRKLPAETLGVQNVQNIVASEIIAFLNGPDARSLAADPSAPTDAERELLFAARDLMMSVFPDFLGLKHTLSY